MKRIKYKILYGAAAILLFAGLLYAGREAVTYVAGEGVSGEEKLCIVVDAGHGGNDPGKVGINGAKE